jgi:hypothetical protein
MAEATSAGASSPPNSADPSIVKLFNDILSIKREISENKLPGILPGCKFGMVLSRERRYLQDVLDSKLVKFIPLLLVEINALYRPLGIGPFAEVNINFMTMVHRAYHLKQPSVLIDFVSSIAGVNSGIAFLDLHEILYDLFEE